MYFDSYATGKRIQHLRKANGMTQEELAIRLNISDRHLRNLERGEEAPSIDLFVEITAIFNSTLDYLILGKTPSEQEELMKKKPYELSGGMCQRVMIVIAMSMKPDYLIADEPTTALDVTVQKQILEEIYQLSRKENLGVLFITHDLGVVAEIADDVSIMKDGEIVENGTVEEIFYHPQHSYTKKLLDAVL